ncbi:guanylate kinase-associated protein mars [Teleopsis dalmanni]|uniref:guanylate kinase-associated protein mars n=1 Tax=Teleopsis dalmanni TaxID=139649 RepID=UPI0018CE86C8|nr:guanylate kinase-associated protein mars [Teleopsis dalmanni]
MERHRSLYKDLNNGLLSPRNFSKINRNISNTNRAEKRMQNYLSCRNISVSPSPKKEGIKNELPSNGISRSDLNNHTNSKSNKNESSELCGGIDCLPARNADKQINLDLKNDLQTCIEKPKPEKAEINCAKMVKIQRQNAFDEKELNIKQTKQNKENQATSGNGTKSLTGTVGEASASEKNSRRQNFLNRYIAWKNEKKSKEQERKNITKPFVPAGAHTKPIKSAKSSVESAMPKNYQFKPPAGIKSPVTSEHKLNQEDRKTRQSIYTVVPTPPRKNNNLSGDNLNKRPISSLTSEVLRNKLNCPERKTNISYNTTKIDAAGIKSATQLRKSTITKNITEKAAVTSVRGGIKSDTNSSAKPQTLAFSQTTHHKAISTKKISEKLNNKQDKPKMVAPNLTAVVDNAKLNKAKTGVSNISTLKAKQDKGAFNKPTGKVNSKPTNTALQRGAIGKIKELQTKQENNIKESHKATHLSRNLKSKKINKLPQMNKKKAFNYLSDQELQQPVLKTPFEIGNFNPFEAFVTSTKLKSPLTNAVEDINNAVSPVKPLETQEIQKPSSDNSAKRALTFNSKKFNFLRYSVIEGSHGSMDIPLNQNAAIVKDKTLKSINKFNEDDDKLKTPPEIEEKPISYLSPFVSVSRGKVSLIKEKEKRNSIYLNSETDCVKTNGNADITKASLSIETRRIVAAVSYFREQLSNEIERLDSLCENWEKYKNENLQQLQNTGGDDMINATIGQTRLLTSKKFMQFKGLIERCESGANKKDVVDDGSEDTKPVTDVDLEGFWSMLGLQIDNVDKRFDSLNHWRDNNWSDPDVIVKVNEKKKKVKPKAKTAFKAKPSSALQEMLRKIHAERRNNAKDTKIDILQNGIELTPSHKRHSRSGTPSSQGRSSSRRISVLVRDRKSFSKTPTIITMTPSSRKTLINRNAPSDLSKHVETINEYRRSLTLMEETFMEHTNLLKTALVGAERKSQNSILAMTTPSQMSKRINERKSILKTPGTPKGKPKNVNFNEKLCIKNFKFIINDEMDTSDKIFNKQKSDYDSIKVLKHMPKNDNNGNADRDHDTHQNDKDENESPGEYTLRNRTIKLRPSSEIIIP